MFILIPVMESAMENVTITQKLDAYRSFQALGDRREMKEFSEFIDKFERAAKKTANANLTAELKEKVFLDIISDSTKYNEFMKFDGPYGENRRRKMFEESMKKVSDLSKVSTELDNVFRVEESFSRVSAELDEVFRAEEFFNSESKTNKVEQGTAESVKNLKNPYLQNLYLQQTEPNINKDKNKENPLETAYRTVVKAEQNRGHLPVSQKQTVS